MQSQGIQLRRLLSSSIGCRRIRRIVMSSLGRRHACPAASDGMLCLRTRRVPWPRGDHEPVSPGNLDVDPPNVALASMTTYLVGWRDVCTAQVHFRIPPNRAASISRPLNVSCLRI